MPRGQVQAGFEGADFGFVGGFDEMPMVLQNAQRLINFYVQKDPDPRAKEQLALLATPGLNPVAQGVVGQARGCWVLPGSQQALVAISNVLYIANITVPGTPHSSPQFSLTQVGTLLTNSGPVVMRDNGVLPNGLGGFVLIVEATVGYYFLLPGCT